MRRPPVLYLDSEATRLWYNDTQSRTGTKQPELYIDNVLKYDSMLLGTRAQTFGIWKYLSRSLI